MGLKQGLAMKWYGIKHIFNNVKCISNGQSTNYAILQNAHRLEKGLCIRDTKSAWGFDKANDLVELIRKEQSKTNPDSMALNIGCGVLASYIKAKELSTDQKDINRLEKLKKQIVDAGLQSLSSEYGGSLLLHKEDMLQDELVERLFVTRHSVRDFADTSVDKERYECQVKNKTDIRSQ